MARKKDCFGSETYVCRTKDCPYMAECVQVVWEKKLRRILDRRQPVAAVASSSPEAPVRIRSRDYFRG